MTDAIHIYTDGSCIPQSDKVHRRAAIGIAFGINDPRNVSEALPGEKQTSARAELAAVVKALELADKYAPNKRVVLYSDSSYAVLEVNRIIHPKEHKQYKGPRDLNGDLIARLDALILVIGETRVSIVKVKGHGTDPMNHEADRLAGEAARVAYDKHIEELKAV